MTRLADTSPHVLTAIAPPSEPIRLHISPLTPTLLHTYLPSNLSSSATNISYHKIQTFPDRPFGYVTLPKMEADRIKKKFNGFILKGSKVRIEEAKAGKVTNADPDAADEKTEEIRKKKAGKRKREEGVLPGYELPQNRKVKRGWTESASERKKKKERKTDKNEKKEKSTSDPQPSRYTSEPEVLFRTTRPPNTVPLSESASASSKDKKKKKSRKSDNEVVVHEFENTKRHLGFLKGSKVDEDSKKNVSREFIDGKGWLDTDGNLIEEAKVEPRRRSKRSSTKTVDEGNANLDSINSNLDSINGNENDKKKKRDGQHEQHGQDAIQEDPIAVHKQESEAPEQDAMNLKKAKKEKKKKKKKKSKEPALTKETENSSRMQHARSSSPRTSRTPPATLKSIEGLRTPHPLETLFKRPAQNESFNRPAPIDTSFSFFGGTGENPGDVEVEDPEMADTVGETLPQTPFNQNIDRRRARSAAPTPDTAAAARRFSFSRGVVDIGSADDDDDDFEKGSGEEGNQELKEDDDEEEEEEEASISQDPAEEEDDDATANKMDVDADTGQGDNAVAKANTAEESAFAKWFWENRGDNNRAWKRRRKEAMKEKRQRENKRLQRRIV